MKKHIKKTAKHCSHLTLNIIGLCITILVIAFVALFWRLNLAPLNVDFITKQLEKTINTNAKKFEVKLGTTELVWNGKTSSFEFHVKNTRLYTRDHKPVLAVPKIGLEISKKYMLLGKLAPKSITFFNPAMRIIRQKDGKISFNILSKDIDNKKEVADSGIDNEAKQAEFITDILAILQGDIHQDNPLSALKMLNVMEADLVIEDQKKDAIWRLKDLNISLLQTLTGLKGSVASDVQLKDANIHVSGNIFYQKEEKQTQLLLEFSDLNPYTLSQQALFLEPLNPLRANINGQIQAVFNNDLEIKTAHLTIKGGAGNIHLPKIHNVDFKFKKFSGDVNLDFQEQKLNVNNLLIDLEEGQGSVNILGKVVDGKTSIDIKGEVKDFPVDLTPNYWPQILAPSAQKWVTKHISGGYATLATLNLSLYKEADKDERNKHKWRLNDVYGEINYKGVRVDYFPPMRAIEDGHGTASYSKKDFIINAKGGKFGDMAVTKSDIIISGLDVRKPYINIKTSLTGSLRTAMLALENDPLNFTRDFDVKAENISGLSDIDLSLKFPLKAGLKIKDMQVNVDAKATNVKMNNAFFTMPLSGDKVAVTVNNEGLKITGFGRLGTSDIDFDWRKNFLKDTSFSSRLEAKLDLNKETLFKIGLPTIENFKGKAPSHIIYTENNNKKAKVDIHVNVTPVSFDISELNYHKAPNVKGSLDLQALFEQGKIIEVKTLDLDLKGLKLQGNIEFSKLDIEKNKWKKITLDSFKMGRSNVAISVENNNEESYSVQITGKSLDAYPFLGGGEGKTKNKTAKVVKKRSPILRIRLDVDELLTTPTDKIKKAKIFLVKDKFSRIDQFEMDGQSGVGTVYMRYIPEEGGGHKLRLEAGDAGAILRALDVTTAVKGGRLIVDAHPKPAGGNRDLIGKVELAHFRAVNVPVLAKLLNALSPEGLQALLSGEGVKFSRLKVGFISVEEYNDITGQLIKKKLFLKNGRTYGSSLGLTFEGVIDKLNRVVNLKGTIVPVSGLNKAISEIPLVGQILSGGSNAMFAATYTIKGSMSRMITTVNPLAALAPGLFRKVFFE